MKKSKIILLAAILPMVAACEYNEKYFEGFDKPVNESPSKYSVEYAEKTFTVDEIPNETILPWLEDKYFTCAEGSFASVVYQKEAKEVQEVVSLDEDLNRNVITKVPTQLNGWLNYAVKGESQWYDASYNGNAFTEMTAYKVMNEVEAWFISPKIKVEKGDVLTFDAAFRYSNGDALSVRISSDFQGNQGSITNERTHWNDVTSGFNIIGNKEDNLASVGEFSLDEYAGKSIYVAFVYTASPSGVTTTVQLDNFLIKRLEESLVVKKETDEYDFKEGKWVFKRTVPSDLLFENVVMQEADFQLVVDYVAENFDPGYIDTQKPGKGEYYYGASSAYNNWNAKGSTRKKYYDVEKVMVNMSDAEADAYCIERVKEGLVKFVELKYPGPVEENGQYVNYNVISPIYTSSGTLKYQAKIVWNEEEAKYVLESLDEVE